MKLTRRQFLKGVLVSAGALSLSCTLGKYAYEYAYKDSLHSIRNALLPKSTPEFKQHVLDRIKTNKRSVWAWLRMVATSGEDSIPSSEVDYLLHKSLIDAVLPTNGGRLQADGTWLQEDHKIASAWAQSLPGIAREAEQLYIPIVNNDPPGIVTVLKRPDLQSKSADELVGLATSARFDAPWDGVYLDLEGIPSAFQKQLSGYLRVLTSALKQAGMVVGVSIRGRTSDSGADYEDAYTDDYGVVGEVADFIDLRCYDYWMPLPRSIGPYWWQEACIQYALNKGIRADQMCLGLGNYSKYWPKSEDITYDRALALVNQAQSTITWVERNENGFIREWYADLGNGYAWIHDGKTYRYGLDLIDQYQLLGNTLFAPGIGDNFTWRVIQDWKLPSIK